MTNPKHMIAGEKALNVVGWGRVGILFIVAVPLLVLLAWFGEYLFTKIIFLDWLEKRWYVPVAVLLVNVGAIYSIGQNERKVLAFLRQISSPLPSESDQTTTNNYVLANILFNEAIVGPVTLESSELGISIARNGEVLSHLPWLRIKYISEPYQRGELSVIDFKIKRKNTWQPSSFSVSWDPKMSEILDKYKEVQ